MMDAVTLGQLASILSALGPMGLLVVFWYVDVRSMRKMADTYREDTKKILDEHLAYMKEIHQMYESNVKLVNAYESLAGDLKDVIIMNTRVMQELVDDINQNQFCPAARVEKKKIGVGS